MTTQQILLMNLFYLAFLGIVIYITRPIARRVLGAAAGGGAVGLLGLGLIVIGENQGFWQVPPHNVPYFRLQLYFALAISMIPTFLITWRVARRFNWRGLAVLLGAVAIIGPPRDYLIAAAFPAWIVFAPGIAPVLADAAIYISIVALGHAVMRLIAGSASSDRVA